MTHHIFAAMSGGVDSSAMAALLVRAGHRVTGATMTLYRPGMRVDDDGHFHDTADSRESADVTDARAVCAALGIPHRTYDLGEAFCRCVIANFVREYEAGRTPNPCVVCNKQLKFGALLDAVLTDGADSIATGHYARIERDLGSGRYLLKRALDASKDQSYFLWSLSQEALSRVLLPLGDMRKQDSRDLAESLGLLTAHKSDSQDICFVPDGDYAAFLSAYTGHAPVLGDFVDESGRVLGPHSGFWNYTVGQRKGLGIALGAPMFVRAKDPVTHNVVLTGNDRLYVPAITIRDVNLIAADRLDAPTRTLVKLRNAHRGAMATVTPLDDGRAAIAFDEPQRAPAPGQSAVCYDGDTVLGGGIIE